MFDPEILSLLRERFESNDVIKRLVARGENVEPLWIQYQNAELPKFAQRSLHSPIQGSS